MDNKYDNLKSKYTNKRHMPAYLKIVIIIAVLIFMIYLIYNNYNHSYIVQADHGEIVDGFYTEALIVREETVVKTPAAGKIKIYCQEGERISYGQKVMSVKNGAKEITLYNQQSGIISYAHDGLEDKLCENNFSRISTKEYDDFNREYRQLVNGSRVDKGDPVFRLIKNFDMYLLIKADVEEVRRYRLNELVFIKPVSVDVEIIKGYVHDKVDDGSSALLIIKLNRYIDEWLNVRRVEIEFIKNIYRGVVVPEEAIFTQLQGDGVLVYDKEGNYNFKKVKIIHKVNGQAVISGLENGENIIANPEKFNYGRGGSNDE